MEFMKDMVTRSSNHDANAQLDCYGFGNVL